MDQAPDSEELDDDASGKPDDVGSGSFSAWRWELDLSGLVLGDSSIRWTSQDINDLFGVIRGKARVLGVHYYVWSDDEIKSVTYEGCLTLNHALFAKEVGRLEWLKENNHWTNKIADAWATAGNPKGSLTSILTETTTPQSEVYCVMNLNELAKHDAQLVRSIHKAVGKYWIFECGKYGAFDKVKINLAFDPNLDPSMDANAAARNFLSTSTTHVIKRLLDRINGNDGDPEVEMPQYDNDDDGDGEVELPDISETSSPEVVATLNESGRLTLKAADAIDPVHGPLIIRAWFGDGPGVEGKEEIYLWLAPRLFAAGFEDEATCRNKGIKALKERIRLQHKQIIETARSAIANSDNFLPLSGEPEENGELQFERLIHYYARSQSPETWRQLVATLPTDRQDNLPDEFAQSLAEWLFDHYLSAEQRDVMTLAGFARDARPRATTFKNALCTYLKVNRIMERPETLFEPQRATDRQHSEAELKAQIGKMHDELLALAHDYLYLLSSKANFITNDNQPIVNPIFARISPDFHKYLSKVTNQKGERVIVYWQFPIQKRQKNSRTTDQQIRGGIDELIVATGKGWKHEPKFLKEVLEQSVFKDAEEQTQFVKNLDKSWDKLAKVITGLAKLRQDQLAALGQRQ